MNRTRQPQFASARLRSAFTLVELLVVIFIVGILLVIVAVTWQRLSSDRIEFNALNTIQGAVRAARSRAMELGTDVALVFDHTGTGGLYRHTPPGHPEHSLALNQGLAQFLDDYEPQHQFSYDPAHQIDSLDPDVRVAPLGLTDLTNSKRQAVRSGDLFTPEGQNFMHLAIAFDAVGRLRERTISSLVPSAEQTIARTPEREQILASVVNGKLRALMSQRGCVAFRVSRAEATRNSGLSLDFGGWLADPANGAMLAVSPWTGRALPGPEGD